MIGHDDLDLLAVRYVTGELAAAETTAFEARLADDQAARDAVEFAVRIAVVSADDAVAPEMSAAAVSPVRSWRLLAAAAILLVFATIAYAVSAWSTSTTGAVEGGSAVAGTDGNAGQAAAEESEDQVLIASWMAFGELADQEADDVDQGEALEEFSELVGILDVVEPPDWMMQGLVK